MSGRIGLVTGSLPFAGLPDNPAQDLLADQDGRVIAGVAIRAFATPPLLAELPRLLPRLITELRPAFVLSLGLALGSPVLRVETTAINRLAFGVADNAGERPTEGGPIASSGPMARAATWSANTVAADLLDAGLPAVISHFAGTHLCNGTLYTVLQAVEANNLTSPVGFLHLPYLPSQVARFLREAPETGDFAPLRARELPSMSFADQSRALAIVLTNLATQANQQQGFSHATSELHAGL